MARHRQTESTALQKAPKDWNKTGLQLTLLLFVLSYVLWALGLVFPVVHLQGSFLGVGELDVTRSTIGSLKEFLQHGFYVPLTLIVTFSIIVPIVKLLVLTTCVFICWRKRLFTSEQYIQRDAIAAGAVVGVPVPMPPDERQHEGDLEHQTWQEGGSLADASDATSGEVSPPRSPTSALKKARGRREQQQRRSIQWRPSLVERGEGMKDEQEAAYLLGVRWLTRLRHVAKSQFVDVYVCILLVGFLNHNIFHTTFLIGFYLYTAFCTLSILSTQLLTNLVSWRVEKFRQKRAGKDGDSVAAAAAAENEATKDTFSAPDAMPLSVANFLFACNSLLWLCGVSAALFAPILVVQVVFEGSLIVDQIGLPVLGLLKKLWGHGYVLSWAIVNAFVLVVPLLAILCSALQKVVPAWRRPLRYAVGFFFDWAMTDIFAVSLLTAYFAFNAFDQLLAKIPAVTPLPITQALSLPLSGFYMLLMAGICAFELVDLSHMHTMDTSFRPHGSFQHPVWPQGPSSRSLKIAAMQAPLLAADGSEHLPSPSPVPSEAMSVSRQWDYIHTSPLPSPARQKSGTIAGADARPDDEQSSPSPAEKPPSTVEASESLPTQPGVSVITSESRGGDNGLSGGGGGGLSSYGRFLVRVWLVNFRRSLKNPVVLFKALALITVLVLAARNNVPSVDVAHLNAQLLTLLPTLNQAINTTLPATVGDCHPSPSTLSLIPGTPDSSGNASQITALFPLPSDAASPPPTTPHRSLLWSFFSSGAGASSADPLVPPSPCLGSGPLYEGTKGGVKVLAKWLTGLSTGRITQAKLAVPGENRFRFGFRVMFASLQLSLRVEECVTPDVLLTGKCDLLSDDTTHCCGDQVGIDFHFIADCNESSPYVRDLHIPPPPAGLSLVKPITVREHILGFEVARDVTARLQEAFYANLGKFLPVRTEGPQTTDDRKHAAEKYRFIPWSGRKISVEEFLNMMIELNVPPDGRLKCPEATD